LLLKVLQAAGRGAIGTAPILRGIGYGKLLQVVNALGLNEIAAAVVLSRKVVGTT
jgi:hypothetical protein